MRFWPAQRWKKEFWLKTINSEMHAVVNECNEVCQLGILDDAWVLYVDKVQGDQTVQLVSKVGTRLPAICSALGKALLHKHRDEEILSSIRRVFLPLPPAA